MQTKTIVTVLVLCGTMTLVTASLRAQGLQPIAPSGAQELLIRGGWLFDGIHKTRIRNSGIVVRNGKFMEVGVNLTGRSFPGARVIDVDDSATILPGFTDMHAHYNMNLIGDGRVEEATYQAIIYLANGVTSTWSAGEYLPDKMFDAKHRIDSGQQPGTRIFPSGPYFGRFRCEYKVKTAEDDCPAWPNDLTEQQIRSEVDYWAGRGVRSIKIKTAKRNEMRVVIDEAHKNGMTTTGHLGNYGRGSDFDARDAFGHDVDTKDAILMGLDRVEHWIILPDEARAGNAPALKDMIDLFLRHHVYFDPTMQMFGGQLRDVPELKEKMFWTDENQFFTPYARELMDQRERNSNPSLNWFSEVRGFSQRMAELKAFYAAGGGNLLLIGTDQPTSGRQLPGFAYHREMEAMVYSGIPPLAVLTAATINAAHALQVSDQLGSIEVGKLADLVIVNGNPLENITSAREIRAVMKSGEVYDPKALLELAKDKIGPVGSQDKEAWSLFDKIQPFKR